MLHTEAIAVVLVEPQNPGNVGMVCRAMKNMGLRRLRVVNGCDIFHKEALKFAVSAKDLLETAERYASLQDALADIGVSVATTRRHGKYRQDIMTPVEVAARMRVMVPPNLGAIVFGREDSGLTTDELALCTWHSTIDASDEYGSLNLAQATLVYCYELFRAYREEEEAEERLLAPSGEMEELYGHMERTLLRIGFLNPENPAHLMRTLRRILSRAELDSREASVMRGICTQIDWASSDFKGVKKS